jgi:uncharacterized protein (TIGR02145 family)
VRNYNGFTTDSRDGKTYKTTTIGTQIWMAENLNYYTTSGSECYNSIETNCIIYGRLYNWETAMANSASSSDNPSGVQGICPSGWHLPSDAEWDILMTAVGGSSAAGQYLKATDGWSDCGLYGSGSNNWCEDIYGFSALPIGEELDVYSNYVGFAGYWWSSTESSGTAAYNRAMEWNSSSTRRSNYYKHDVHSVRCIKDL